MDGFEGEFVDFGDVGDGVWFWIINFRNTFNWLGFIAYDFTYMQKFR